MPTDPRDSDPNPTPHMPPSKESLEKMARQREEEELPETEPMSGPPQPVSPPEGDEVSFDDSVPTADPASFALGRDLKNLPEDLPMAEPASSEVTSSGTPKHDPDAAVGNLEPVAPVDPASGWLDSDVPLPSVGPASPPLAVERADLFEAPPQVESSDIFSTGSPQPPKSVEGSDVIAATAFGEIEGGDADKQSRPSDVAISFDQPPGGSTVESATGHSDLPVAEEVFEGPDPMFDSARLGGGPEPEAPEYGATPEPTQDTSDILGSGARDPDAPEYGSSPGLTQDASSILADLSDPGDITIDDSSAIPLESPGVGRTLRPSSGTEFDLTIGEGEIPPELADAVASAESGIGPAWTKRRRSDPAEQTEHELDMDEGRVVPVDPGLAPADPSSIFDSINDPVVFKKTDTLREADDEQSAVEFSDHPDAAPEGSSSALLGPPVAPPSRRPSSRPMSEPDFELPADRPTDQDSGAIDWSASDADSEKPDAQTSSILYRSGRPSPGTDPNAPTRSVPPVPGTPKGKAGPHKPLKSAPPAGGDHGPDAEGGGSVEIDWVSGSSAEQPVLETPPRAPRRTDIEVEDEEKTPPTRAPRAREPEPPKRQPAAPTRGGGGMLRGALVGMVFAGAACAGIYFSGVVPNSPKTTQAPKGQPGPTNPDGNAGNSQPAAAIPGQSRVFGVLQELGKTNATVTAADNPELKQAREELQAVADNPEATKTARGERQAVEATLYIGVSHELAGDRESARKVYAAAVKKFPNYAATFEAALDRLDATTAKPAGTSLRLTPDDAQQLLLTLILLQDDPPAKAEPEAGVYFWKAVNAAAAGKYADAIDQIGKAKAAHAKQVKANPGRGVNPLSDPLEQIFSRACDDLEKYWKLREAVYANKAIAELIKKEGSEAKAMAELAAAQRKANDAVKFMTELTEAKTKLAKADADLVTANNKVTKAEGDLKDAKELVLKAEKARTEAEDARKTAETARKSADELIASLAKELQAAKLLPEKYDNAALLAAQKTVTERATGPTLSALLPPGMMAVVGGPLTAGQLTDIGGRLAKAEAAAKAADAKLAAELKKVNDAHATAVKKLTDGYMADAKKLMDTYATNTTKLKDDHAAELKKMADKFAADMKKLETALTQEKERVVALTEKFKIDLGNAMSPSQALDVWLPLLTDLRRAGDAEPALGTATKVMATSPPDSEDVAKARTVAGMAHFVKGDMVKAKELFTAARSSPAYKTAGDKAWAKAADVGLRSIDDPLAPYRKPIPVAKRDPKAGARFLDAGVKAYRAGRYADAVTALTESTKADDSDPIAWYFLGAAKWAAGATDKAKDDFLQGAEREKFSLLSTRAISDSLAPIQGAARDALTAARP
jgi:hypothetical protein